jgi:hypothetical protein
VRAPAKCLGGFAGMQHEVSASTLSPVEASSSMNRAPCPKVRRSISSPPTTSTSSTPPSVRAFTGSSPTRVGSTCRARASPRARCSRDSERGIDLSGRVHRRGHRPGQQARPGKARPRPPPPPGGERTVPPRPRSSRMKRYGAEGLTCAEPLFTRGSATTTPGLRSRMMSYLRILPGLPPLTSIGVTTP